MGSWKTTTAAVLTLIGVICSAGISLLDNNPNTNPDFAALGIATTTAFGLLFAKDAK